MLADMEGKWENINFQILSYKASHIIKGLYFIKNKLFLINYLYNVSLFIYVYINLYFNNLFCI